MSRAPRLPTCSTLPRVGASQVDVALLRGSEGGSTLRTVRGHNELALRAVTKLNDWSQHLGNHVARLA